MQKHIYFSIGALAIFGVMIWTVNSFYVSYLESQLDILAQSKQELSIKQSFVQQGNLEQFSKSINDFIPSLFDKGEITDLISQLARESSVQIVSINIQDNKSVQPQVSSTTDEEPLELDTISPQELKTTYTVVVVDVSVKGDRRGIDSFLEKIEKSNKYFDISAFSLDLGDIKTNVTSNIVLKTYYTKL